MNAVVRHNQTVLDALQPGDLVEFERAFYSHWAVYIGDGQVVHLTGENDGIKDGKGDPGKFSSACPGVNLKKAFVQVSMFWEVAGESKAFRNNRKDRKQRPSSGQEIVERALSKLGEIGYNVIWKNCEHFASWCRYGVEWSEQVDSAITLFSVGTAVTAGIAIFLGLAFGKQKSKQGNRT